MFIFYQSQFDNNVVYVLGVQNLVHYVYVSMYSSLDPFPWTLLQSVEGTSPGIP